MPALLLRAFAKINLGLRILSSRPDGYHEIRTVYQAISLADRLDVWVGPRAGAIEVEADDPSIPQGPTNLAYRASEAWRRVRKFDRAIRISIQKSIPSGSGLGGASSDAAAALVGLERLTGDKLPLAVRLQLACELGSDVPFFLIGGRAFGCGRGEEVYDLPDLPRRHCLVVFPGFAQSTRAAYAEVDLELTGSSRTRSIYSLGKWPQFPWKSWEAAENDFESVVLAKWPELLRLKRQLLRADAEVASLTGSGTAVYAIFDSAQKLALAKRSVPPNWRAFATHTLSRAEYRNCTLGGRSLERVGSHP